VKGEDGKEMKEGEGLEGRERNLAPKIKFLDPPVLTAPAETAEKRSQTCMYEGEKFGSSALS
jgi:hypothetical protein